MSVLQSRHLLSPVEEVCVVDDVAAELGEVEDTVVLVVQLVVSGLDEPVTQAGLASALATQTIVAGGYEPTHRHPDGGDLPLAGHT